MLPWTPLLLLPVFRGAAWYREPRRMFLLAWFGFGLVLFSASANKLPGYVLPLLPAAAALAGLALDEIQDARGWLLACAVLLIAFPVAAPLIPAAAANEWSAAPRPAFHWTWLAPAIPAAAASILEARGRRVAAVLTVTAGTAAGMVYVKVRTEPQMERMVSARRLAAEAALHPGEVCARDIKRDWQYGLNYYLGAVVPDCLSKPTYFRIVQAPGLPPSIEPAASAAARRSEVDPR
jgi:4-amino-4-deoxy-L-arabinose transferase-like glycosyltransferase